MEKQHGRLEDHWSGLVKVLLTWRRKNIVKDLYVTANM